MLLSLVLTMMPVTHARLLDNDEAAIALVDDPVTTRKELQLQERHLLDLRPSYGGAIAQMVTGTLLLGVGGGAAYLTIDVGPSLVALLDYIAGSTGAAFGMGIVVVGALFTAIAVVAGVALVVMGIVDAVETHHRRVDIDAELAEVRNELKAAPADASAPKTLTLMRF